MGRDEIISKPGNQRNEGSAGIQRKPQQVQLKIEQIRLAFLHRPPAEQTKKQNGSAAHNAHQASFQSGPLLQIDRILIGGIQLQQDLHPEILKQRQADGKNRSDGHLPFLPGQKGDQIQRDHHQNRFVKQGRSQNQKHKFPIFPLQHIPQAVQGDGKDKIIAHRVKCPEIESQQHEQGEGQWKIQALVIHGLQKQEGGCRRKKAEYQKIIFPAGQGIEEADQQIKAGLRHHIASHIDFMKGIHVVAVIVSHIDAQSCQSGQHRKQKQKRRFVQETPPVQNVSPLPASFVQSIFCFHQTCGTDRQDADESVK